MKAIISIIMTLFILGGAPKQQVERVDSIEDCELTIYVLEFFVKTKRPISCQELKDKSSVSIKVRECELELIEFEKYVSEAKITSDKEIINPRVYGEFKEGSVVKHSFCLNPYGEIQFQNRLFVNSKITDLIFRYIPDYYKMYD